MKSNSTKPKVAMAAVVCLAIGLGIGFSFMSLEGSAKATVTITTTVGPTVTLTTTAEQTVSVDYAVELEGCSISNKTCVFQILDVPQGGGLDATLGQGSPCVWLSYGPADAGSADGTSTCTVVPYGSLNNGGSATLIATFQAFGGVKAPVAGESVYGCISERWNNGTTYGDGCLPFLGNFTT